MNLSSQELHDQALAFLKRCLYDRLKVSTILLTLTNPASYMHHASGSRLHPEVAEHLLTMTAATFNSLMNEARDDLGREAWLWYREALKKT